MRMFMTRRPRPLGPVADRERLSTPHAAASFIYSFECPLTGRCRQRLRPKDDGRRCRTAGTNKTTSAATSSLIGAGNDIADGPFEQRINRMVTAAAGAVKIYPPD